MPSPVGHALAGIALGWIVDGVKGSGSSLRDTERARRPTDNERGRAWLRAGIFASVAIVPDFDLLVGAHSGPTHGVGSAVIVGLTALIVCGHTPIGRTVRASACGRFALAIALAYASHTLLDWLSTDSSPPIGIMALWPFSRDYYESSVHLFLSISRQYWQPNFWRGNLRAVIWELVILLPVLAIVWVARGRSRNSELRT